MNINQHSTTSVRTWGEGKRLLPNYLVLTAEIL